MGQPNACACATNMRSNGSGDDVEDCPPELRGRLKLPISELEMLGELARIFLCPG